jgi:hypothetical protein
VENNPVTDEQLQDLFAGMQRHLEKSIIESYRGMEVRFDAKLSEMESRIDSKIEKVETALISEFWKWASPVEARARGSRDTLHALELEVDSLKERMRKLEGRQ